MPARRLRYKQTLLPNDVNAPDTPSNEERARSRSRSPHGLQAAPSPPGAAAAHRDSVTSRSSDGQAANGRSTTTRLSGSFRQSKTRVSRMRTSFAHRDFDNPYAETCWLSCLFQTLWHSVVFHRAFDEHLAVGKYRPSPAENILTALQRTWADYEFAEAQDQHVSSSEPAAPEFVDDAAIPGSPMATTNARATSPLIPSEDLADGFGEGYGDMSEAMACVQQETRGKMKLFGPHLRGPGCKPLTGGWPQAPSSP